MQFLPNFMGSSRNYLSAMKGRQVTRGSFGWCRGSFEFLGMFLCFRLRE